MRGLIAGAVGLAITVLSVTATRAESVASVLKFYGMVGVWSPDCADKSADRVVIASPFIGTPSYVYHSLDTFMRYDIAEGERITEDKFRLIVTLVEMQPLTSAMDLPGYKRMTLTLTKIEKKVNFSGGWLMERCLN